MSLKKVNSIESAYKFLTPLFISGGFFLLSFYFCLLSVPLYKYTLPFYALFLLISLFLYYRIDQALNHLIKMRKQIVVLYGFYHNCIGIYLILSILLFGVSVAYIPFYQIGGSIFVWYCAPMSLLSIISFIQSHKRKKWLKKVISRKGKTKRIRTKSANSPNLKLVIGNNESQSASGFGRILK
jgi:heme exporter protein D